MNDCDVSHFQPLMSYLNFSKPIIATATLVVLLVRTEQGFDISNFKIVTVEFA